ncbi:MAG: mandelate racemase/muconate lactonizing enzyme family protein [Bryobacter sp.]|jgi:galactonate dehydratase|nr:mandelate racemase/muconate lactonizing enzyme family protein [Bryobacter sp. CoA8 C33]
MKLSRRNFLSGAAALSLPLVEKAQAELKRMKITRIRYYESSITRPMVNQSFHIVTVETDAGLTGIGEGGSPDLVRQVATQLIGQDPTRIEHLWQLMFRGLFYPAGREKTHSIGALDLALWDLKGKALGVPVHQLLGGLSRDYIECYCTGFPNPQKLSLKENARACVEYGFRAFRTSVSDPGGDQPFQNRAMVLKTLEQCQQIREGVGKAGDWAIDYHTRLDFPDAVKLSALLEPLEPYFCEDLVRSENNGVYRQLRPMVKVPIAVGEQHSHRWDINELIENRLIDYNRVSIPNCGGITEYMKLAALCETHYVGQTPHFTGPVGEAALVHCTGVFPGPVMMEMTGTAIELPHQFYLPQCFDFKAGKLYPNNRPGLGVTFDASKLKMFWEVTRHDQPIQLFRRPDGSLTNW